MPAVSLLNGPWQGMQLNLDPMPTAPIGLGVDQLGNPLPHGQPFAIANYVPTDKPDTFTFNGFRMVQGDKFLLEFVDGPCIGASPVTGRPAQFSPPTIEAPLTEDGSVFSGEGDVKSVAVYERRQHEGRLVYFLDRIENTPEAVAEMQAQMDEHIISGAINQFYEKPDYDIYSIKPTGEHVQVPVEVGHRKAHVDELMAGIVTAIWQLDMDTIGSCQQRPAGSPNEGKAYVAFIRRRDAKRVCELLQEAGIEHTYQDKEFGVGRQMEDGTKTAAKAFPAGTILFATDDIAKVDAVLASAAQNQPPTA